MFINDNNYHERASYTWSENSIRLILTPSVTAKSFLFYIQETGYFQTDDSYFTERKNLDSFLLVYTLSGHGILKYDNQAYDLYAGSCFFIHCVPYHYYETASRENWEFLWIHFNGITAESYFKEFIKNGFQIIKCQNKDWMEATFRKILSVNKTRDVSTELYSSNLINNLITELLLQTISDSTKAFYLPDYVQQVINEIEENFTKHLTLDDLSKKCSMSKFHLSRNFKKYVGVTINEYIINARISYSKILLKTTEKSVNEIALLCGIENFSHFINLFKAREGMTPLAYRKAWR